jgi:DNA-binding PadR family transcriptional regulator
VKWILSVVTDLATTVEIKMISHLQSVALTHLKNGPLRGKELRPLVYSGYKDRNSKFNNLISRLIKEKLITARYVDGKHGVEALYSITEEGRLALAKVYNFYEQLKNAS